jgi:hypothetical protein
MSLTGLYFTRHSRLVFTRHSRVVFTRHSRVEFTNQACFVVRLWHPSCDPSSGLEENLILSWSVYI